MTLLDLQGQDSTLSQLAHRHRSLPEHAVIDELSTAIKDLDGRRVEAETSVSDLSRDQAKASVETGHVKARRQRDEERMNSGAISSPKDLANMQREIVALDRRISTLEDEELEVMESLETAQTELDTVLVELAALQTKLVDVEAGRDAAASAINAEAADATAERDVLAAKIPADLLAQYEKSRAHGGGLGAAALRHRRCEGCRLEINGADLREIATKPDDEVLRCPECNRILVRTLESGL